MADYLTFVKERAVCAHKHLKKFVRLQKSPYLCTVKTKQGVATKDNKTIN